MTMEFEIKKEGNEKYLSAKGLKFDEGNYQIQMIMNNNISGIVPITIRNINNEKELLYDITGMSNLSSIFERSLMRSDELVKFTLAIKQLSDSLREYLLCEDNIKFDFNYIYYKAKQKQYCFCYCPGEGEDFSLQIKTLFNQVLDYVNYNDKDAVALAYGMQEVASRDDFTLEELLEFALGSKEKQEPIILEDEDYEIEEDVEDNEEEKKKSFFDTIKKMFRKNKEESEDSLYIEETEENFSFDTDNLSDEDATVLLTSSAAEYIVLKSVNHEQNILVAPNKYPYVIGKSKRSSDYKVSSNVVSRVHARLNCEMGVFTIEDLNSTNGTFVNDERLKPHEIKEIEKGDVIKLADLEFSVE